MKTKLACFCTMWASAFFLVVTLTGCSESKDADPVKVQSREGAASQLEQAFENASGQAKDAAKAAADAIRKGEYEKAVVSLHAARQVKDITIDQGIAIQTALVSLEQELITAMEGGDANAKKAYDLLKRSRRN